MYIDELFSRLCSNGTGCHLGGYFVGSVTDDVALLAPSPSALRALLKVCESFALEYGLVFNAAKTQLICFSTNQKLSLSAGEFRFFDKSLSFCPTVTHLGHILSSTLDDTEDMCRKANYLLQSFAVCDPIVKTKLIASHHLSLYGAILCNIC